LPEKVFHPLAMSKPNRTTCATLSGALAEIEIQLLPTSKARARARRLLAKHHYLGDVRAVGEQLFYAITDGVGDWLGVLVFCAASRRLAPVARPRSLDRLERGATSPSPAAGRQQLSLPPSAAQNFSQSRLARSAPDARPPQCRLAGALRPLIALGVLAHLCGAPRGQKEWALFAKGLSQTQRRALGIRQQADGYPTPGASTFWRLMAHINADSLEKIFLQVQEQIRGPAPLEELIVLDGKEPRHGGGHSVLTAVTVPSQHYLGSAIVDTKTNEIPVARALFKKPDLDGRKVSLDALHTQDQTARELGLEHGADFLLTVKDNQPTLRANIEKLVTAPPADFSPSPGHPYAGRQT
jgi:hypothetical protein